MEKPKILVVDDEPRNQRILSEILEDEFNLIMASNGAEALSLNDSERPDLILLDIMMPGIDGYEVCSQIKKDPQFQFTKIILVSGKALIEERLKGYSGGADDYLTKPFIGEELLAKAKVFLRLNSVEKELNNLNKFLDNQVQERTKKIDEQRMVLIESNRLASLGEVSAGIAHEINNPLAVIAGKSEIILRKLAGHPDFETLNVEFHKILDMVTRISKIISGLKTFARDGSRDSKNSFKATKIFDDLKHICQKRLTNLGVNLHFEVEGEDVILFGREVQICQVLLNLINNAADAIQDQEEKWIKINVRHDGRNKVIKVTDSGSGISPEIQQKIMAPFFTTKAVGKGTGLGLSISFGIIKDHGGVLRYDESLPHTSFIISLPTEESGQDAA